jgi:hypothetical protein
MVEQNIKLPNHIEEYINKNVEKSPFVDLLEGKDIDLRSDVSMPEIIILNAMSFLNKFLLSKNLISPYDSFITDYLRLKVSLDRKSRSEFVIVNKKDKFEDDLNKFNSFNNLKKVKE